jgi:hypothetical protein
MSVQQEKFKEIADKIREYTGTTDLIKPNNFAAKIDCIAEGRYSLGKTDGYGEGLDVGTAEGIEQGKQAQYDEFWDNFQQNGKLMDYRYAFNGAHWNNKTFNPKYPMHINYAIQTFENCGCTDCDLRNWSFNWGSCYNFQSTFKNFKGLVAVGEISCWGASNLDQIFYGCSSLTTIEKLWIPENATFYNNAFYNCTSLTYLRIGGTIGKLINLQWSPLDKESIESVINSLSTITSGLTATFNKSAKEAAFTDEEWATLTATKPNWTISLV